MSDPAARAPGPSLEADAYEREAAIVGFGLWLVLPGLALLSLALVLAAAVGWLRR